MENYIDNLPKGKQLALALRLAKLALPIWKKYSDENDLSYQDTKVGLIHRVDRSLVQNSIKGIDDFLSKNKWEKFIDGKKKLLKLRSQFDDPIAALQDTDWELPDEVRKTFYAVFNLLETLTGEKQSTFGGSTICISINQVVDALSSSKTLTVDEIKKILANSQNGR